MKNIPKPRRGTTLIECMVAASILTVAIATVTMAVFRIGRIWTDTGHYRIALQEVSNQLETLTQLPPDQAKTAIDSLVVSSDVARSLVDAKFSGELIQDEFGDRVKLALTWGDDRSNRPIHMTAWLAQPTTEDSP
jgi:Tfp pilus assembly protein PilV